MSPKVTPKIGGEIRGAAAGEMRGKGQKIAIFKGAIRRGCCDNGTFTRHVVSSGSIRLVHGQHDAGPHVIAEVLGQRQRVQHLPTQKNHEKNRCELCLQGCQVACSSQEDVRESWTGVCSINP